MDYFDTVDFIDNNFHSIDNKNCANLFGVIGSYHSSTFWYLLEILESKSNLFFKQAVKQCSLLLNFLSCVFIVNFGIVYFLIGYIFCLTL